VLTCSSRQPSAYTFPLVTRRTPFPEIRYLPFSRSDLGSQNARLTLGLLDHQLDSFHSRGRESAFSLPACEPQSGFMSASILARRSASALSVSGASTRNPTSDNEISATDVLTPDSALILGEVCLPSDIRSEDVDTIEAAREKRLVGAGVGGRGLGRGARTDGPGESRGADSRRSSGSSE